MIEVELKNQKPLDNPEAQCLCGEPATWTATIGQTQNYYGTDYDLCANEHCLNAAMDNEIEEIDYIRTHRKELADQDHWNNRAGK